MGWEGLAHGPLCRALKDPQRNGRRDVRALIRHLGEDPLVSYGWDPGGRRTPVPIPRETVVKLMEVWTQAGSPCPR